MENFIFVASYHCVHWPGMADSIIREILTVNDFHDTYNEWN